MGERGTLTDYLHAYRQTLELKCRGLDAQQMARRSVPPLAVAHHARAGEVGAAVDEASCEVDLSPLRGPRPLNTGDVGRRVSESSIPIAVVAEVPRRLLASEHDAEPVPLLVGHMADKAE